VLLALLGAGCFSLKAIFVKLAYRYGVDAETLLALRMGYALPCFLVMGLMAGGQGARLTLRDWALLAALGLCGYYLSSYLDFLGLRYISAALERLILFSYPTMVLLLSAALLGKPIPRAAVMPMLICYVGIALAVSGDMRAGDLGQQVVLGSVLVGGSALSYALYLMWSAEAIKRLGASTVSSWATCVACVLALAQFFVMRPVAALAQPLPVHGWAVAMALVSTVLPIWFVAQAMRRIGAGPAAMIGTIGPVLTIFFGWLFLGEQLASVQILGGVLVLAGVWQVACMKQASNAK